MLSRHALDKTSVREPGLKGTGVQSTRHPPLVLVAGALGPAQLLHLLVDLPVQSTRHHPPA